MYAHVCAHVLYLVQRVGVEGVPAKRSGGCVLLGFAVAVPVGRAFGLEQIGLGGGQPSRRHFGGPLFFFGFPFRRFALRFEVPAK